MNRRRSLYDLIQRETPGGPGGGGQPPAQPPAGNPSPPTPASGGGGAQPPAGGPPADWQAQLAAAQQALAHSNSELDKVRKEAAGYRTQNKGAVAEAARALAQLAGVEVPADGPPDINAQVAALAKRDAEREQKLRSLEIDNALKDMYPKHAVDGKLTKALLLAEGVLDGLDPYAEDFGKTLEGHVKRLSTENPNLKSAPAAKPPTGSHAPIKPPQNDTPQLSKEELPAMKPEQVAEALKKGQLDEVLGRRSRAS